MPPEAIVQQLATVRMQLDRACERFTSPSPDALEASSGELESAVRSLAECQPQLGAHAGNASALEEAWRVRRSLLHARKLLHGAATFHGNWMRIRGAMVGGYTSQGEPGSLLHAGRISLQA